MAVEGLLVRYIPEGSPPQAPRETLHLIVTFTIINGVILFLTILTVGGLRGGPPEYYACIYFSAANCITHDGIH